MTSEMYGVVLKSNPDEMTALIWLEDDEDVALYREFDRKKFPQLEQGDLVQTYVSDDRHGRFAHRPRVEAEGMYADVVDLLMPHQRH